MRASERGLLRGHAFPPPRFHRNGSSATTSIAFPPAGLGSRRQRPGTDAAAILPARLDGRAVL